MVCCFVWAKNNEAKKFLIKFLAIINSSLVKLRDSKFLIMQNKKIFI